MNISTGRILAGFAAAALTVLSARAETKVLYEENFESAVPGQPPAKWGKVWGGQGGDTIAASSEKSAAGDNSLLLDRTDNAGQWGFGFSFPRPEKGVLKVEFDLLLDGPGNQAALGFEIRENVTGRSVVSGFTVDNFAVRDAKHKKVFEFSRDQWYHVTFAIPLTEADGSAKTITLRDEKTGREATLEWAMTAYPAKLGQFLINTQPGKNNYRAFFDNVKVSLETK